MINVFLFSSFLSFSLVRGRLLRIKGTLAIRGNSGGGVVALTVDVNPNDGSYDVMFNGQMWLRGGKTAFHFNNQW